MNSPEKVKQRLREAGLKATPARLAVMDVLKQHHKPITAQTFMSKLKDVKPDQVTVYRILSALVQAKVVREVSIAKGVASYELADRPHHHHVVCEGCGRVEDVPGKCIELPKKPKTFKHVTSHQLEYAGICNECA